MKIAYHVMSAPAPLGLLFLAGTERGLRYTEFMDRKSIKRMIARYAPECPDATWEASLLRLKAVVDQFEAYFCGALMKFELALDPVGSEFQIAVWNALRSIPYGETRTYGEIARAIGMPKSARAVGLANHDNPIAIIVPCHRVIGADGSLTGYGGGLSRKRWLLRHEARFAAEAEAVPRGAGIAPGARPGAAAPASGARVAAAPAPGQRAKSAAIGQDGARSRMTATGSSSRNARTPSHAGARTSARARSSPPARGGGRRASVARSGARPAGHRHTR